MNRYIMITLYVHTVGSLMSISVWDVPPPPSYGVYISQLVCTARIHVCSNVCDYNKLNPFCLLSC